MTKKARVKAKSILMLRVARKRARVVMLMPHALHGGLTKMNLKRIVTRNEEVPAHRSRYIVHDCPVIHYSLFDF
jgi:hypothetical protein